MRYVRAKNSRGSTYSLAPSPRATWARSAANSAWRYRPAATSGCGVARLRQGASPFSGSAATGAAVVAFCLSFAWATAFSMRIVALAFASSSAWGAATERRRRSAVS